MEPVPTLKELRAEGRTRALVVGLGTSGRAAARLLEREGFSVRAVDERPTEELLAFVEETEGRDLVVCLGRISPDEAVQADFLVVSPGVPPENEIVKQALSLGLPVMSELDAAWQLMPVRPMVTVAVTGTNGKSTVTKLLGGIFEAATGEGPFGDVVIGGNIGEPLSALLDRIGARTALVLEVSSFQLYFTYRFNPDISVLLNLTPDHMDWHYDFDDYARAKGRLVGLTATGGHCVLNYEDERVRSFAAACGATVVWFTGRRSADEVPIGHIAYYRDGVAVLRYEEAEVELVRRSRFAPAGAHNSDNLLAAAAAAYLAGARSTAIDAGVAAFEPLRHRMEPVGSVGPIDFVDDSKATNPDAVVRALEGLTGPAVVILGGKDKGLPYDELAEAVARSCFAAVTIGEAAAAIEAELAKRGVVFRRADDMDGAVRLATGAALSALSGARPFGEAAGGVALARGAGGSSRRATVILSPACSSFDMFESYAHRGRAFAAAVSALAREFEADGRGEAR